jgi:hypothetical protein
MFAERCSASLTPAVFTRGHEPPDPHGPGLRCLPA